MLVARPTWLAKPSLSVPSTPPQPGGDDHVLLDFVLASGDELVRGYGAGVRVSLVTLAKLTDVDGAHPADGHGRHVILMAEDGNALLEFRLRPRSFLHELGRRIVYGCRAGNRPAIRPQANVALSIGHGRGTRHSYVLVVDGQRNRLIEVGLGSLLLPD